MLSRALIKVASNKVKKLHFPQTEIQGTDWNSARLCSKCQRQAMPVHTNEVEEGETDKQVGSPVETIAEGKGSSSYTSRIDFTQDQPGHCGGIRKGRGVKWSLKRKKHQTIFVVYN